MIRSKSGKTAIAIFVKTPGLSRVKTRLGHKVGELKAKKFYELSLKKIKFEINELKKSIGHDKLDVYWAIAEPLAPFHTLYWKDFNFIHQKGNELGTRISGVYNQLINFGYEKVVLMGGDSPQLTSDDYKHWCGSIVKGKQVIMGPANDGGFYTFIGAAPISQKLWEGVNYSQSTTCQQLDEQLSDDGFSVFYLNKQMDIDFYEDLAPLKGALLSSNKSSVEQKALIDYISTINN